MNNKFKLGDLVMLKSYGNFTSVENGAIGIVLDIIENYFTFTKNQRAVVVFGCIKKKREDKNKTHRIAYFAPGHLTKIERFN